MITVILFSIAWFLVGFLGSGFTIHRSGRDIGLVGLFVLGLCGILGPVGLYITLIHFGTELENVVIIRGRR